MVRCSQHQHRSYRLVRCRNTFRCVTNRMPNTDRRNMLRVGLAFVALPSTILYLGCGPDQDLATSETEHAPGNQPKGSEEVAESTAKENSMQIQYLEIVTPDVDAVCQTYSKLYGVTFKRRRPKPRQCSHGQAGVRWYGRRASPNARYRNCLLYTSPSPRDATLSRMPSSA